MYKARFKQWAFVKNNTEKVVSQILRTKFERDAAGKLSQFTRNGKDVNLTNYLQRKGLTEYDLVDFHPSTNTSLTTPTDTTGAFTTPNTTHHIRCLTPPLPTLPTTLRPPDRLRFHATLITSFQRAFLVWRADEHSSFSPQSPVFTWRVTDFPHLSHLIDAARLLRAGDSARGSAALHRAFRGMESYLASMDATATFYFFFHRQSRAWQGEGRIAVAVWRFLAARGGVGGSHPLFQAFKVMYEVVQKEGAEGLRVLLSECAGAVADELERAFGREHWLANLICQRCFPEKSKVWQRAMVRDLWDCGPARGRVRRLY